MAGIGKHNMKNIKLSAFLNTPLGAVIAVGAVAWMIEILLMESFHRWFMVRLELSETVWGIIDAAALTIFLAPALYFLVFRKMRESVARLQRFYDTARDAIVMADGQGRITGWNLAAQRMFQYSREEAVGQPLHQLITPPRYRDDAVRGFANFANSGEGLVIGKIVEMEALRKDGSEFPVELSITAVKERNHWRAMGVARDISERKEAEAAFQTLFASLTQNIGTEFFHETVRSLSAWLGAECVIVGELLDGNRVRALAMQLDSKAVEHYEYALPGTPCNSVASKGYCEYPEGVCQLFPGDKDLANMGAEAYVGTPVRNRNGETRGILCAISRHKLDLSARTREVMEMIAARIGMEIEREQAEKRISYQLAEIKRARLEWQTVFDSINDPIFLHDSEFRVVRANTAYAGQAGKSLEEIIGQPYYAIFPKSDGPLPSCLKGMEKAEEEEEEEEEEEVMVGEASYRSRSFSVRDEQNNYLYSVHIFEDITERKWAAETLRESERRFSHLFENMSSAVAVYQPDAACEMFTLKSANRALERIEQVKREEILGRSVEEMFPGVRAFGLLEVLQRVCRSGEAEYFPPAFYQDGRISGWRENYVYRLDSGEIVAVYDDVTERKETEEFRRQSQERLSAALEDAIGAIAATLEQRDPYTAGHQRRVAELAVAIGEEMGLAREVLEGIHFGGMIHDIGKISVPAEILGKPGRLTEIEFGLIKVHAEAGYQIVKGIAFPWPVADMVRQHHERLDGSGYPQGFKDGQITLEARILAVADVVEAMSADRPYRPGFGLDAALEEITRVRGAQLDPAAVDACLRVVREKGFVFSK